LNFDVDVRNNKICLISDIYYELDLNGNSLYTNSNIDDIGQGTFDFGPAIEIGKDGIVHVIHRDGGDRYNGFNIRYSKRELDGTWSVNSQLVGSPVARNYVVDVVGLDGGEALCAHSAKTSDDVWGSVFFYALNGTSVGPLGDFGRNVYHRSDSDFRMESYQNRLHFASGKPNPYGVVYYMEADISASLPTDLASSARMLEGDYTTHRRGQPDLKIDDLGNVFVSYGDFESVYFERYSNDGTADIRGERILSNLGEWHLDLGLSAIDASSGGDTVLVVGLETGGNVETASSCALLYTCSFDGGLTWTSPEAIPGLRTNSAEGRSRPKIHYYDHQFFVFFNNVNGGISLSTFQLEDNSGVTPTVDLVDPVDLSIAQLTTGRNFDVEVANDRIYIISDHYCEYNLEGEKYSERLMVNDIGQDVYDFGPALAVGSGGEVHVFTRIGGNRVSGFNLAYSRKGSSGSWMVEERAVGTPAERNFVVDVVALDNGDALCSHGSRETEDGFGTVHFYRLSDVGVELFGNLGRNDLYKVNSDFRMEQYQNKLHLSTGKPFEEGSVYYSSGTIGSSLISDLTTGITTFETGEGMYGQPDLCLDNTGRVYLTYGSNNMVLFNQFSASGSRLIDSKTIFDKLGDWKLNLGLSAIGSDPEGDTLLAVGLKTDGTASASNCILYYTYSTDGGNSWIYPLELTGLVTSAGEGRMRPRVEYYKGRFYIFYYNNAGGIGVKTIDLTGAVSLNQSTPLIYPSNDTVSSSDLISIESSDADAIYYSFEDDSPDMLSTPYNSPFTIDSACNIYAIAYRRGYLPSSVATAAKKMKTNPIPQTEIVDPIDLSIENLCSGNNFDVEVSNDRIYLISDHYFEFDLAGTLMNANLNITDYAQGSFDYSPTIAVGSDSVVHVVTRNNGSISHGFNLKYSKKKTDQNWAVLNEQIGLPTASNSVVDVIALDNEEALVAHSALISGEEYGSVFFYALNDMGIEELGDFGRNDLYSINSDFRMDRHLNQIHIATGKPDEEGTVYYMQASISSYLPLMLAAEPMELTAGDGRRGQADLSIDNSGNVFVTYGSEQSVIFNRFSADGKNNISDQMVLNKLGSWNLDLGLSALASTPDGDTLLVLGLKTDDSDEASNCELLYTYSFDGGENWVFPKKMEGSSTNGGKGSKRPRVKFYKGRFYVFFNNRLDGIAVETIDLRGQEMIKTEAPVFLPDKDSVYKYDPILLSAPESDAIYYSFTNPKPDYLSTDYTAPFFIDSDRIIYARAYRSGYLPSDAVWAARYVIITSDRSNNSRPEELLRVFPVPAFKIICIESSFGNTSNNTISIYNHKGQLIHTDLLQYKGENKRLEIDVSSWTPGLYILKLSGESHPISKRFLIK